MSKKKNKSTKRTKGAASSVNLRDVVNLKTLLPTSLKMVFIKPGMHGDIFWPRSIEYNGNGLMSKKDIINDNVRYAIGSICRRLFRVSRPDIFIAGQSSFNFPVFKTTLASYSKARRIDQILACIGDDCLKNRKFASKESYVTSLCRRSTFTAQEVNDCLLAYAIIDFMSFTLSQLDENKAEESKAA